MDLEILFEGSVYTQKEKERLLNKLVPSITLRQALSYRIITDAQADDLKYQQIKLMQPKLSEESLRDIVSQVQDSDIRIATSQFTAYKKNREILIDDSRIFEQFAQRYNESIDTSNQEIAAGNVFKSADFKENLERFPTVKGVNKLKE